MSVAVDREMNDDDILRFTQSIRKRYVDDQMKGGVFPEDKGERALLLQTLTDMDRTSLSKKKLVIEAGQSEDNRKAAEIIAQIALNAKNGNMFVATTNISRNVEVELNQLPSIDIVPGGDSIGISEVSYSEFIDAVEGNETASEE